MERLLRSPVVFLTIGALFAGIAVLIAAGLYGYEREESARYGDAKRSYQTEINADRVAKDAARPALETGDIASLGKALALLQELHDPHQQILIKSALLPRLVEAEGEARDALLREAFDIREANPNSPEIGRLIEAARAHEDRALELLRGLGATIDEMRMVLSPDEWRRYAATLRYLEGYTEFWRLPFIPGDQQMKTGEALDKAREAFTKVFPLIPKDTRTEYALESLYKVAKKQQSEGQGSRGKVKKPMLLQRPGGPSSTGTPGRGI